MKRNVSLDEISDGKLYTSDDMVKAGCSDCKDCSDCCRGMGRSIILDPFDIYRMTMGLKKTFEELLFDRIELNVVDGIILPNLKLTGTDESCTFLSDKGRCTIHGIRPGLCRLFPLGRYYMEGTFKYFLQIHECSRKNRTKVRVRKWIDTPEVKSYESFINKWHTFLKKSEELFEGTEEDEFKKLLNLNLLKNFYLTPFKPERDFYEQFNERIEKMEAER